MSSPLSRFHGAFLKIERANKHIDELQSCVEKFLASDFYSVTTQDEEGDDFIYLKLDWHKPVPEEISLIIGDAIHNLRTALDFAYGEAIGNRDARLPFRKSGKEFAQAILRGKVDKSFPNVAQFLRDVIKPYPTGNDPICALHRLDIADKHQLLIPTIGRASATAELEDWSGKRRVGSITVVAHSVGSALDSGGRFPSDGRAWGRTNIGRPKLQNNADLSFQILFGNGLPLQGEPIIPALHQLSQIVYELIGKFEKL